MKYIKFLAIACLGLLFTLYVYIGNAGTLSTAYIDTAYLTSLPFGSHSHWIQPWRAYLETLPAAKFLNGIGVVWNEEDVKNPELVAQMLAKHGIRQVRFGINWSTLDYDDETQLKRERAEQYTLRLLALKKYGIRPLILLNAHHGAPCPHKFSSHTLVTDARIGDTKILLNDVSNLKVNYSVLSLNGKEAAEAIITEISGNTITLSKPLIENLKAEEPIKIITLKYRPFSVPGSSDYQETIAGWQNYVGTVANFVTDVLGTKDSSDKGFELEIWNELTFGSNFLYINKYYSNKPFNYDEKSIWTNLVTETINYIEEHSEKFQGVQITNGFANTIPWPASSEQPKRISAISKHPYRSGSNYPKDEPQQSKSLNALGEEDNFIPTYSVLFPEYPSTGLISNNMIRDMGPITSKINGVEHGRYARGSNDPVPVWITEINFNPKWIERNITAEKALAIKAKTTARYLCFYLNKGASRVYLYGAAGGDEGFGIIQQNFLDYAKNNTNYPSNDTKYISPALQTINRIVAKISDGLDPSLENAHQIEVISIRDFHNHYQFKGRDNKANPNLYNRDLFVFLPFQVNNNRFVIPYYVMTRRIQDNLAPEKFELKIQGIENISSANIYDPINNKNIPTKFTKDADSDTFNLELMTTDYPYLLTIDVN